MGCGWQPVARSKGQRPADGQPKQGRYRCTVIWTTTGTSRTHGNVDPIPCAGCEIFRVLNNPDVSHDIRRGAGGGVWLILSALCCCIHTYNCAIGKVRNETGKKRKCKQTPNFATTVGKNADSKKMPIKPHTASAFAEERCEEGKF